MNAPQVPALPSMAASLDPADKLKAMAMERAARADVSVYETGSGGYAVGWSAREVPDLRSLQRVLTQMGAAA